MRQKINWFRYLGVFLLTIIIFILGIFIGGSIEDLRVKDLYTKLQEQDLEYQNIVTENLYMEYLVGLKEKNGNISCETLKSTFLQSINNLEKSRNRLENFINTAESNEEEFYRLKGHYSNLQIHYWILTKKINSLCDFDMVPVLYFYSDDKICNECSDQGIHLSYVKSKLKDNVLIYSFDKERMDTPSRLIIEHYNITFKESPVVIIEDKVYGYITNEQIFDLLCSNGLNDSICS